MVGVEVEVLSTVNRTLGSDTLGVLSFGNLGGLFKIDAISNNAFFVLSPILVVGIIDDGGAVKILMISPAACFKKSSSFTSGIGTLLGKNVTVSTSLSALVLGKNTRMHL